MTITTPISLNRHREFNSLERLKRVIRQALSESAHRIKLQVGTEFEILAQQGIRMMQDGPLIDAPYLTLLNDNLLPHEKANLDRGVITKGVLSIPNVGKVYLIAQSTPPASLRLYLPPRGQEMFEADWQRLTSSANAKNNATPPPLPADLFAIPADSGKSQKIPKPPTPGNFIAPPDLDFSANVEKVAPRHVDNDPLPGFIPPLPLQENPTDFDTNSAPHEVPSHGLPLRLKRNHDQQSNSPPSEPATAFGQDSSLQKLFDEQSDVPPPPMGADPLARPVPTPIYSEPNTWEQESHPLPTNNHQIKVESVELSQDRPEPVSPAGRIHFGPTAGGETVETESEKPIDIILREMVKRRASDVHMTCMEPLSFRIDGEIERIGGNIVDPYQMELYIDPILPAKNRKEFLAINDTDFAYELKDVGRFRVNIFRDKNGVGSVIRHIPSTILTAEQLNLPPAITKFCALNKGLVVVTGPTGSGKSTTLAAMVDLINKTRADHILTIEDPVEFVHPQQKCLVNQREVHRHTTSFARALKAALREDPDIILIGEMRDLETISIAIETAETGHLVFGTLHTTTAVSTVDRIIDQFPSDRQAQIRTMLSSSLKGVVAQTLLRKKGGGRVAAHEILVLNDAVSSMIREGKIHMVANHMQTQKADGNILLNENLFRLVKEGLVDVDEAIKKSVDKNVLIDALRRANLYQSNSGTSGSPGKPLTGQKAAS